MSGLERLTVPYKQEVAGSSPAPPMPDLQGIRGAWAQVLWPFLLARLHVVTERRLKFDPALLTTGNQVADLGFVRGQRRAKGQEGLQYISG